VSRASSRRIAAQPLTAIAVARTSNVPDHRIAAIASSLPERRVHADDALVDEGDLGIARPTPPQPRLADELGVG
jgi:hypothetical protein